MTKRLGIVPYRYAQPLFTDLRARSKPKAYSLDESSHRPPAKMFELVEDVPAQLAIRLREKQLDGAFVSPIDYAKDYAMYRLLPSVAAISEGESETVLLFFHEHARKFKTIGFDPTTPSSDIVLATLVLKEKYDVTPQLVPFVGSIDVGLRKADAVLVSGDVVLGLRDATNRLDLVDEWNDISELPYVHGVWVTREGSLTNQECDAIIQSAQLGDDETDAVLPDDSFAGFQNFRYRLDEVAVNALTEFFRMAYYHGILQDVPEVRFVP